MKAERDRSEFTQAVVALIADSINSIAADNRIVSKTAIEEIVAATPVEHVGFFVADNLVRA